MTSILRAMQQGFGWTMGEGSQIGFGGSDMNIFELPYTVVIHARELHHDGEGISERVTLKLDNQPGSPVMHWGSAPHSLTLVARGLDLGDKVIMTLSHSDPR